MSHFLEPASDKKECIDELALILKRYIRIIDSLIAVTVGHPSSKSVRTEETIIPSEMSQVLPLLLQALGSSSNTVRTISRKESPVWSKSTEVDEREGLVSRSSSA